MTTSVSAKRCPECGKPALLRVELCPACGHLYRTRFVEPPVERTEAFEILLVPPVTLRPPRRTRTVRAVRLAISIVVLLATVTAGLLWLGRSPGQATVTQRFAAAPVSVPVNDQAKHLYNTIELAMSLYQLDKTAGGTGRVIRVADPHTLLLAYDYPKQSVHVSLSRPDLSGGNYQVQAVALYQGKALLFHHAQIE